MLRGQNKWSFCLAIWPKFRVWSKLSLQDHHYLMFHIQRESPVCSLWLVPVSSPIRWCPYGRRATTGQLIPLKSQWTWLPFALLSLYSFRVSKEIKAGYQAGSGPEPWAELITCCCADWGVPHTKPEKCGSFWAKKRVRMMSSALPGRCRWRKERLSQQARATGAMKR